MSRSSLLSLVFVTSAACAPFAPVPIVCHNSHCTGPANPVLDDTPESLAASLALRTDGRPTIDGVELDTFWNGADDTCLFAHDLEKDHAAPPVSEATALVVAHLDTVTPATFRSDRFLVFLEMKPETTPPPKQPHTAEQNVAHAACVLDQIDTLRAAAGRSGTNVEVTITSFEASLLQAVVDHPRWTGKHDGEALQLRLAGIQGTPPPLSGTSRPWSTFGLGLADTAEVHASWVQDAAYRRYRAEGLRVGFWMFSATAEHFRAIASYGPDFIVTSEAPLLRAWMEARVAD